MADNYHIMAILAATVLLMGTSAYVSADIQLDQQNQGRAKMRTDKELYKCDEKVTVNISGKPNTTYLLVIKDPNGNIHTQVSITTDANGNATHTYMQSGPSGVWLLELHEIFVTGDKRLVAEWKYKVECDKQQPPPQQPDKSCLTVVSDLQTFVDRGNTVPVSFNWPAPISGSNLGIAGVTPIWSSNGLDTGNPYTFTKHFILPQGYTYYAKIDINADDQWKDLRINGNFVADEPAPIGWGNVHTYTIPSTYLNAGLNTLTVQAVDIAQVVAGLAFKMEVFCKPIASSIHWDKIVFTIDIRQGTQGQQQENTDTLTSKLRPLIGKTLDIKVRDNPADVVALEDVVKGFLAAKYNLTKQETDRITVRIVEVEYAIDTNVHAGVGPDKPKDKSEAGTSTKGSTLNSYDEYIYYALPFIGVGAVVALWYKRSRKEY
jgi:hypothetical protein